MFLRYEIVIICGSLFVLMTLAPLRSAANGDTKESEVLEKAEKASRGGFVIAPVVFALSSLPYLGVPAHHDWMFIGVPILVNVAAITNIVASPIVAVRGKRVRERYNVSGNRGWRIAG
jgi:hypothetical protein